MAKQHHTPATRLAKRERRIKVNQQHYTHPLKGNPTNTGRAVPWIQMKGLWLKEVGFEIDTPVKIRVMEGCLVLTVE